jgi:signal transduction histidine kinase
VLGIAVFVEPSTLARRSVTVAGVGALVVVMHIISRASRPVLASWILVLGLSMLVTQRAWITGGIDAPVAVFYGLFIVMAAALIGARGAFATAVVCFLGGVVLTVGTALQWLTVRPHAALPVAGFCLVVLAIGLALVIQSLVALPPERERHSLSAVQLLVHDMRTPMQLLLSHLELLRDSIGGDVTDDIANDVDAAIESAAGLRRMTTSFLDLSRLEAGRMPVQRSVTNLSELARSVVSAMHALQPARDLAVETHGDCSCVCDPEMTRRIVENLVTNAMKHTPIDRRVRVVVSGLVYRVQTAVHDEGPGVPAEHRSKIFEPFSAEGLRSATGYESSGLGLAFCKLAIEAQGGTIRIEEGTPRGTVFVVALPR